MLLLWVMTAHCPVPGVTGPFPLTWFNNQLNIIISRQLQCGFSGSSPMVCCPPSLPRKAVEGGGNPAVLNVNVNVDVNSRTNLDIGGLNARTGSFPLSQEETTLWSEEFGPKWIVLNIFSKTLWNPVVNVDVDVNSRTNLDIGGLNARTGSFPLSQEETTLWSEEFGPKW